MYKFSGSDGAVVCDGCGKIIESPISISQYRKTRAGWDFCDECLTSLNIVDNFDLIEFLMGFNNSNEFYFLQIIQRKKDGNVTQVANNGYRTVKTYYIYSKEQLRAKENKIKELCLRNNARAYITLNRRNANEVALASIQEYAKLVSEGNAFQGYRVYDSACGQTRARDYKAQWIVDVDTKDEKEISKIIDIVNSCRGQEDNKIKAIIPTVHGVHLLTSGFDSRQFAQELAIRNMDPIDIQKDNPTLLYYASYS